MLLSCQTLDVLYAFYIFFETNLLTQCQVPVLVFFHVFDPLSEEILKRSPNGRKSPKTFFRNGRISRSLRAKAGGPRGPHKPPPRSQGEAAAHRLVGPLGALCPRFSAAASFCLRKIPSGACSGALPEGDSDKKGFFINTMTSPMMRE